MVAAEAAACGALPVIADHTGLAEVAAPIRESWPEEHRHLLTFEIDADDPVRQLADVLIGIRQLPKHERDQLAAAAREVVAREWSWTAIAAGVAEPMLKSPRRKACVLFPFFPPKAGVHDSFPRGAGCNTFLPIVL